MDEKKPETEITQEPAAERRRPESEERPARKPYRKPRLTAFGDVREATFGASPGVGDSANPALLKP